MGIALSLVVAFSYFIMIVITDGMKHKPNLHPENSDLGTEPCLSDNRCRIIYSDGKKVK